MTTTPAKAYHHGKKGMKAILADLGDAKETWLEDENTEINRSPEAQLDAANLGCLIPWLMTLIAMICNLVELSFLI